MRVPVRFVVLGRFRLQQPCRCSAGAHRAQAAQPAAGSRCSCGAGGHGARAAAAPLSECETGQHGGRAAGDDRAETPGPLLRGGCAWAGVPGLPAWQGRHASGLLPVSEPQRACFVRFAAALPARRYDTGSTFPMGSRCRFALALAGSAARASQRCRTLQRAAHPA